MSDKIKSLKTFLVNSDTDDKGILIISEERDPQGNILLETQHSENGARVQKVERIFDDQGRVAEERQYTINDKPDQLVSYEYNESGKISQIIYKYLDGTLAFKKYHRDEAENTTTIDLVDEDGTHEGKEVRKFDHEDRMVEETIYDEDNEVLEKREIEYDEHGQVAESYHLDTEGFETIRFFDYYHDDKKRIIKIATLDQNEVIIRTDEFEYDERGNQSKHIIEDKARGFFVTDVWTFDLQNRLTNHQRFRGETLAEETHTRYREDNLIKEQETRSGGGVFVNYFKYEFH